MDARIGLASDSDSELPLPAPTPELPPEQKAALIVVCI